MERVVALLHTTSGQVAVAGAAGVVGVLMLAALLRQRPRTAAVSMATAAQKRASSVEVGECKMVILVRTDLNMSKGKAAAQCCHAVLAVYKYAMRHYPALLEAWEGQGQPKITLKVEGEEQLREFVKKARSAGLPAQMVQDAGRTQVAVGTTTVAAIGPGPVKLIDYVTGSLKLY